MRMQITPSVTLLACGVVLMIGSISAFAQGGGAGRGQMPAQKPGPVPRLPDGKPDLQGIWNARAFGAADNVEDHLIDQFGIRGAKGIVVDPADGKIPYKAEALERKKDLFAHHMYEDPEAHCTLAGVPRQMYAPFGFQIFQPPNYIVIFFEAFHAFRIIPTDGRPHIPENVKLYSGDSRAQWEGDTLVIDVTNQNDKTWFDMAGNFHSDQIHVIERLTPVDSDTIRYEATIQDPKVYTKPWKIQFDFAKNKQPGYELMEFACVEGERDLQHYTESEGKK